MIYFLISLLLLFTTLVYYSKKKLRRLNSNVLTSSKFGDDKDLNKFELKQTNLFSDIRKQQRMAVVLLISTIVVSVLLVTAIFLKLLLFQNDDLDFLSKVITLASSGGLNYYSFGFYQQATEALSRLNNVDS